MTDILLTNDDGITSDGIAALRRLLDPLGTVVTLAPATNRSAIARSITIGGPLRARTVEFGEGYEGLALDGTPADCVRAAAAGLLGRRPRVVVAGVNLGPNVGDDIVYSGTVAAALEAAAFGIPAVAVSIASHAPRHLDDVVRFVEPVVERVAAGGLPPGDALNINLPDLPLSEVRGVAVVRIGSHGLRERIVTEPAGAGERAFVIAADVAPAPPQAGTDLAALADGFVAVTPLRLVLDGDASASAVHGWGLDEWLAARRDRSAPQ
jgi:5'-nucleotidase